MGDLRVGTHVQRIDWSSRSVQRKTGKHSQHLSILSLTSTITVITIITKTTFVVKLLDPNSEMNCINMQIPKLRWVRFCCRINFPENNRTQ